MKLPVSDEWIKAKIDADGECSVEAGWPSASAACALLSACQKMADDYQTSDNHHPNHVLVPLSAFEEMRAALTSQPN